MFSRSDYNTHAVWAMLLEKAWAKIQGSFLSSQLDSPASALYALTGAPIASYNLGLITPANLILYSYFNVTTVSITTTDNVAVLDINGNPIVVVCALNNSV